jgi:hypothetical protein
MGIRTLSRTPDRAQDVAPEVKLTLIRDVADSTGEHGALSDLLTAIIPVFVNKDPSNPAPS